METYGALVLVEGALLLMSLHAKLVILLSLPSSLQRIYLQAITGANASTIVCAKPHGLDLMADASVAFAANVTMAPL